VKNQKKNLRKVLSKFNFYEEALDTGTIISVKDGVAKASGL
jgi:F0F1-type ATP synthase alpha subunit